MKIPVLLPNIFDHPFTYESDKKVEVGRYVLVPFGKKDAVGVVWDQFEKEKNNKKFKIKKIKNIFNVNKLNENCRLLTEPINLVEKNKVKRTARLHPQCKPPWAVRLKVLIVNQE